MDEVISPEDKEKWTREVLGWESCYDLADEMLRNETFREDNLLPDWAKCFLISDFLSLKDFRNLSADLFEGDIIIFSFIEMAKLYIYIVSYVKRN